MTLTQDVRVDVLKEIIIKNGGLFFLFSKKYAPGL